MRVLPAVLLVLLAALHHSACADKRRGDAWTRLGRELLIRAKLAGIIGTDSDVTADDSDSSGKDQEHVLKTDALEDIFVGQNDQSTAGSGTPEATKDKGEDDERKENENEKAEDNTNEKDQTDKPEGAEEDEHETDKSSGDAGEDGEDEDDSDDDEDDGEKSTKDKDDEDESEDEAASGDEDNTNYQNTDDEQDNKDEKLDQQLTRESENDENADKRTFETSGSGSGSGVQVTGNEDTRDDADSSGSEQQQQTNVTHSEEASGSGSEPSNETSIMLTATSSGKEASEDVPASKRSEVENSPGKNAEDDGSAAIIRKGVESLSRLLSPVASGFDFTLYSGSAVASESDDKDTESEGEDESGQETADLPEVKVKQCKQVCELPMTFHECAVPRCDLKMGTIKDLCFWLCEHQKEVCRQECE